MKPLIIRLIDFLQHDDQERKSALTAMNFGVLTFFLSYFFLNEGLFETQKNELIAIATPVIYMLAVVGYFIFIVIEPQTMVKIRRHFFMLMHNIFLTVGVYNANEYGILAVPLYLWIIMASGVRFGKIHLYSATVTAVVFVSYLALFNPYWKAQPTVSMAIVISLVLIPFSYISLIDKIQKAQDILKNNLVKMQFQAKHDYLTSMPNRAYLQAALLDKLSDPKLQSGDFALIFIDLDGFKNVNDTLGHHIGDAVLKEVSRRITEFADPLHFAARLGGDEFVIIFDASVDLEKSLVALLALLEVPYAYGVDYISASIGATYYKKSDDSLEEQMYRLKKEADEAMYAAKKLGKNQFVMYQ